MSVKRSSSCVGVVLGARLISCTSPSLTQIVVSSPLNLPLRSWTSTSLNPLSSGPVSLADHHLERGSGASCRVCSLVINAIPHFRKFWFTVFCREAKDVASRPVFTQIARCLGIQPMPASIVRCLSSPAHSSRPLMWKYILWKTRTVFE
jgi:hypothetical protein